jgi:hypothetical protein
MFSSFVMVLLVIQIAGMLANLKNVLTDVNFRDARKHTVGIDFSRNLL